MKLSVVIPTHNRAEVLKATLQKILEQKGAEFEVIVVDDGSTDDTESVVRNFQFPISNFQINPNDPNSKSQTKPTVQYIKQSASHQGAARNRGVEAATGDIIVFIGDDIFVEPGFLKAHADRHAEHPEENVVVLGYSTWDSALPINDYMRFLESSGWQFGYRFLSPGSIGNQEPYKFFYTSNISLKRSFFEREKFDEQFKVYGWEDVELGYRLWKNHNMKLFYAPEAKAYHHHLLTEADLPKKMQAVGQSAVHFERLHPEVQVVPKGMKSIILRAASSSTMLSAWKMLSNNLYFKFRSWGEFLDGMKNKDIPKK
jgi:glycosyltransferase involved in cell wall biosynthesis